MLPHNTLLTADNIPFNNICDTGASKCAFQSLTFFPNSVAEPTHDIWLGGIANSLLIHGIGTAAITLRTHHSTLLRIHIPHSLYVPELPCNLLSPQWLVSTLQKQNKKSSFHIFPNGCLFLLDNHVIPLTYHPTLNLPVFQLATISNDQAMLSPLVPINMEPFATNLLWGFEAQLPPPL